MSEGQSNVLFLVLDLSSRVTLRSTGPSGKGHSSKGESLLKHPKIPQHSDVFFLQITYDKAIQI